MDARRNGRIAVIGSINTDLVTHVARLPKWGETLQARNFGTGFGGKGANQAVAAAKLGAAVAMVGRVGDDVFGRAMRDNLAAHGIDITHVESLPGVASGVAPIFVDADGRNAILIVGGANAHMDIAGIEAAAPLLRACDLLLLQLEIPLETVYAAIAWAVAAGVPVWLNPAPAAPALAIERLAGLDMLIPNQTELTELTGLPAQTPEQAETAARTLIARGIGRVLVTLGEAGALLVEAGGVQRVAPVAVNAVDTTGAGDAFIGALAAHHVEGHGMAAALRRASAYAADSVTRAGAQEAGATRAEFEAFLHARSLD